jgi:hypothetical protein
MAETSHEIRRQIEDTRARIGTTIAALERKVDPKRVVDDYPLTLVGVAFGTGLLLATTGATSRAVKEVREQVRDNAGKLNDRAGTTLDGILSAVLGAATTSITGKVAELLDVALGSSTKSVSRPDTAARAA